MVFYLNVDAILKIRNPGLVDYLDEEAMNVFLSLTRNKFYAHLKEYFGNIIKMSFFDEPTMHWLDGRTWTPSFNKNFEKQFGYSPMRYYPALWYDIGPETAAARNALYGFRAQLVQRSWDFIDRPFGPGGSPQSRSDQWRFDESLRTSGHPRPRRHPLSWQGKPRIQGGDFGSVQLRQAGGDVRDVRSLREDG
jgi:hypothetical protein